MTKTVLLCFPSKKFYGNIQYHLALEEESPRFSDRKWPGVADILEELQNTHWYGSMDYMMWKKWVYRNMKEPYDWGLVSYTKLVDFIFFICHYCF